MSYPPIENLADETERMWETDGLTYTEMVRQEYAGNGMVISAGFVEGHPIDTMYFRMERPDMKPIFVLLRPDEVAIIAWAMSGILFSHHIQALGVDDDRQ